MSKLTVVSSEFIYEGHLDGNRLSPLRLAELCREHGKWIGSHLVVSVAVCLAESLGHTKAHNNKFRKLPDGSKGEHISTDIGLFEIATLARDLKTPHALKLWEPEYNIRWARRMYDDRGWQPWHAYTRDIALNPDMRGKYIQKATWAVMNLYRTDYGLKPIPSPYIKLGPQRLEAWAARAAAEA